MRAIVTAGGHRARRPRARAQMLADEEGVESVSAMRPTIMPRHRPAMPRRGMSSAPRDDGDGCRASGAQDLLAQLQCEVDDVGVVADEHELHDHHDDEEIRPKPGVVFGADPQVDERTVPEQDGRTHAGEHQPAYRHHLPAQRRRALVLLLPDDAAQPRHHRAEQRGDDAHQRHPGKPGERVCRHGRGRGDEAEQHDVARQDEAVDERPENTDAQRRNARTSANVGAKTRPGTNLLTTNRNSTLVSTPG